MFCSSLHSVEVGMSICSRHHLPRPRWRERDHEEGDKVWTALSIRGRADLCLEKSMATVSFSGLERDVGASPSVSLIFVQLWSDS